MWPFPPSNKLGYAERVLVCRSLRERLDMALHVRPAELLKLLRNNADSYRIETTQEIMQFVAVLDRPLSVLLDELEIPRERFDLEFIEFHGPLPYNPNRYIVRKVVPGLISAPRGFSNQVQPMMKHIVNLPILVHLDFQPL